MWTSVGRYFSKAAFSGAFMEVWPITIVDSLLEVLKQFGG